MCFNSDTSALQAAANQQTQDLEQQNAQHAADVQAGSDAITSAFSQFDQPYFDAYGQSYEDVYNPQLTDQYNIAKDQMYAKLAGNDQLGGSVGNNDLAQLDKTYANNQADIANSAADAENAFKASVNNTENNLFTMNANAADPSLMAQQAQAAAGAVVAPSSYPTLSNVFGDALSSVATAGKANANSMYPISYFSGVAPIG